mmetsp:Transcript_25300/g.72862  ORF Transcript_25300/g.72862 Transcript_25300/m.72862 type:complete len:209 (+) Transcript_25300:1647-2273(+)
MVTGRRASGYGRRAGTGSPCSPRSRSHSVQRPVQAICCSAKYSAWLRARRKVCERVSMCSATRPAAQGNNCSSRAWPAIRSEEVASLKRTRRRQSSSSARQASTAPGWPSSAVRKRTCKRTPSKALEPLTEFVRAPDLRIGSAMQASPRRTRPLGSMVLSPERHSAASVGWNPVALTTTSAAIRRPSVSTTSAPSRRSISPATLEAMP